jgi:hypothetical protein
LIALRGVDGIVDAVVDRLRGFSHSLIYQDTNISRFKKLCLGQAPVNARRFRGWIRLMGEALISRGASLKRMKQRSSTSSMTVSTVRRKSSLDCATIRAPTNVHAVSVKITGDLHKLAGSPGAEATS